MKTKHGKTFSPGPWRSPGFIPEGDTFYPVRKVLRLLWVMGFAALLLASCTGKDGASDDGFTGKESPVEGRGTKVLRISDQYGLAYAPLQIMRRRGYLREELPDYVIEWNRLGNTAAIREAILAGRLHVGFMGIPPFLIGYDRGMKWKIFTGLSRAPLGLVSWRDDLQSLEDFGPDDRIALPQPGSIQHILLAMACERELGEAGALDDLLVTMNHPDGMQALLNRRSISAHFTSPPYLMEELSTTGMHQLLSGREAMGGDFTFIVGVLTEEILEGDPEAVRGLRRALEKAREFLMAFPHESAVLLSEEYQIAVEKVEQYLKHKGMNYEAEVKGIDQFISFMEKQGYLGDTFSSGDVLELKP